MTSSRRTCRRPAVSASHGGPRLGVAHGGHGVEAAPGQFEGDRPPDAPAGARDQRAPSDVHPLILPYQQRHRPVTRRRMGDDGEQVAPGLVDLAWGAAQSTSWSSGYPRVAAGQIRCRPAG